MSKDLEQKVKIVFASYPEAKAFHFTADGQAFRQESDAKNHARTLDAKEVTKITRQMVAAGSYAIDTSVEVASPAARNDGVKNEFQKVAGGSKEITSAAPRDDKDVSPKNKGIASAEPRKD